MRLSKILKHQRGDGYIDAAVFVLAAMLILILIIKVVPVFIFKNQLNHFANELIRAAQITGTINISHKELSNDLGISPDTVCWEAKTMSGNKVQLNEKITVTATIKYDIGLFENFGSFPVTLRSKATGRSEVYWK